jgi:light-regulated signal transduction histidine kinase (bacteriophytochrome)
MSAWPVSLREDCLAALQEHLRRGEEAGLSRAYELGRQALAAGLGVLDLAALHDAALSSLVLTEPSAERVRVMRLAAAFFSELVAPFEMSLRGYREANAQLQGLNESLRRQVEQTENVNRELESFSYSVSHDLRAPLRAIDGFSQLLLARSAEQLDATGRRYLEYVRQATGQMAQLIDDLINLARVTRQPMQRHDVDLTLLARSISDRLHTEQPGRAVTFSIQPDVHAKGDLRLLSVLLENLLGNAWKFTSKRADARIEFGSERKLGVTVYHVRDNGAGFDMAYAAKLFVAFSRLHPVEEFEGTGIGLATVQRIVHRHGGQIWALGQVNGGASFYFTLDEGRAA